MKDEPVDWKTLRFGDVIWLGATNSYMYVAKHHLVGMIAGAYSNVFWMTKAASEIDDWKIKERLEDAND
jgi:hypothetical protein